jgi:membrane fusion protein, multidrug efflux system
MEEPILPPKAPEVSPPPSPIPPPKNKGKKALTILIVSFLVAGIAVFIWWFWWLRFEVYTTDAYVGGNKVIVTPQIPGIVTSITADDTDYVTKGRTLITLDTTDAVIDFEKSKAELANAVRTVLALFQSVEEQKAEIEVKKAEFSKAVQDFDNRRGLVELGGVAKEDFEHAEAALISSYASLLLSEYKYLGALAQVENTTIETHPQVLKAKELVKESWVNLQRCDIEAPVHGIVAQRNAQVGESVDKETPLLAVIPFDQMWVDANFKEVQLTNVRLGQPVTMTSDIYGSDVVYHGTVIGIGGGTGSVFSVLPPQNATGNWIKIVQRLPVRISLDPDEIKQHPLRLGLSMEVTIDIHDKEGMMIPEEKVPQPLYETDIFEYQERGSDEIISEIIRQNSYLPQPEKLLPFSLDEE